jgi:hypothetical protein
MASMRGRSVVAGTFDSVNGQDTRPVVVSSSIG